tara:strand:- start:3485 stop:3640 length:156 start_codon:yes stop_codon:yes gene_type:complete
MKLKLKFLADLNNFEKFIFLVFFLLVPFGIVLTPILIKVYNKVYKKRVDKI